jgi:acyl-CoA thioester hydrolase
MRVVYYANYFVWFEVGRCELLRALGRAYTQLEATGVMLPVIEAQCDYRRSAHYDDELTILTAGELLSPARVRFDYEVSRPADDTLVAVGRTVHAAIDQRGKPVRLSADVRGLFGEDDDRRPGRRPFPDGIAAGYRWSVTITT